VRTDTPDGQGEEDWDDPGVSLVTGDLDDRVVAPQRRSEIGLRVTASLGAGDDTATLGDAGFVRAGPGDDRVHVRGSSGADLRGDQGDDVIVAAAGADSLHGGPGDDVLDGGPGADTLLPDEGDDSVAGGPGFDMLSYVDPGGVRVDLARKRASSANGRVRLRSVEGAFTGTGDDVLVGDARANQFVSFGGEDVMRTGAGDDVLEAPAPGSACGAGLDVVVVPTVNDFASRMRGPMASDCERARFDDLALIDLRPRITPDSVELRVRDVAAEGPLRWELRDGGRLGFAETTGDVENVSLTLSERGRACVARPRCDATLVLSPADGARSDPLPLRLAR
jgi:Ca2+-binding RTX toxin-like protein